MHRDTLIGLVMIVGTAACGVEQPQDAGHACWPDDPVEADQSVDIEPVVTAWNSRALAGEYDRLNDNYPLPDAPDTVSLGTFEATGRVWTVSSPHDPYSQGPTVGCFEGDRVLVEGRVDVTSTAGLYSIVSLPLILDAPASGSGEFGVFPGRDRGTMRQLYVDLDGAEFGTVVSAGGDAEAALEDTLVDAGQTWPEGATWFAYLEFGDAPGRITLGGLDSGSTAADPYEESLTVLDGGIEQLLPAD